MSDISIQNSNALNRGRGAQEKRNNRFEKLRHEESPEYLEHLFREGEPQKVKTTYQKIFPKTIVNQVQSPDIGIGYSMNPYQGCEHGCVYCYARNTHEYWGYGPGIDFESKILVKEEAPKLLDAFLRKPKWKATPIVLSGNTDCYQPAEKHFEITRACLEVFLKYRHPVGIITKNAMILRDLDLLKALHKDRLIGVHVSVTSLNKETRSLLEPRTTTTPQRLKTIRLLSEAGIPVNAMLAPIIPGINSHEIMALAEAVAGVGARSFGLTVVRLNGAIGDIFTSWIQKALPDKAEKVLSLIKSCHGGSVNDSRFGIRQKGEGAVAEQLHHMAGIARRRYFKHREFPELNTALHQQYKTGQLPLF
ncbi:PA0069 family radical SAM protein [Robiginitalea aurantiaca]|uniref:PA0069 family radical SAM protein n=1 Tax=Robiginitalea aurantiaca TaxID=3056915 RepID=A0ABT7WAS3_9FLAO|nr:PA0069 family radical SAM protein [Robiginitalea aurantiaca]MDM9630015.1 PA0069 family radical SAM protein [Robiginitalea aurantiaca]